MTNYNPVSSLRNEVKRFKETNRFTPLLVTGFYCDAACVLDYVSELESSMIGLLNAAEYVCQHRFGESDPVGTRIVAVSDLAERVRKAKKSLWHLEPNEPK